MSLEISVTLVRHDHEEMSRLAKSRCPPSEREARDTKDKDEIQGIRALLHFASQLGRSHQRDHQVRTSYDYRPPCEEIRRPEFFAATRRIRLFVLVQACRFDDATDHPTDCTVSSCANYTKTPR